MHADLEAAHGVVRRRPDVFAVPTVAAKPGERSGEDLHEKVVGSVRYPQNSRVPATPEEDDYTLVYGTAGVYLLRGECEERFTNSSAAC